jgi:beta-lactamase class C
MRELAPLPAEGIAVVVRIDGRTFYVNIGDAERGRRWRPVTSDSLFNLASVDKVLTTTLLAQAVMREEVALDDLVTKYVPSLEAGNDIRRVTLGQLATHTSGLDRTPEQYERWHRGAYNLPDFLRYLIAWKADIQHEPGRRNIYSNSGIALLRLALEARFKKSFAALLEERLTKPLGMGATVLMVTPALRSRAVQGYGPAGAPIDRPGDERNQLTWPGSGQIFTSARDMGIFLAANLGEVPDLGPLQEAMALAQKTAFPMGPRFAQALAWQVVHNGDITIVDKNGGLLNTSTYIGMVPDEKLGIAILVNRGRQPVTRIGRQILLTLAGSNAPATSEGSEHD